MDESRWQIMIAGPVHQSVKKIVADEGTRSVGQLHSVARLATRGEESAQGQTSGVGIGRLVNDGFIDGLRPAVISDSRIAHIDSKSLEADRRPPLGLAEAQHRAWLVDG